MFIDEAKIYVESGKGGDGAISFHRTRRHPKGGPDGGDGGRGGAVLLRATATLNTLQQFKHRVHFRAEDGAAGGPNRQTGRDGRPLIIDVPLGTVIKDAETAEVLADLVTEGEEFLAARGGEGGRGNAYFATPTRQAPRFSERGAPGEGRWLKLELQLLADVGIVGYPNAGKSTLISAASAARPKIAPYPFTTLEPCLGVVQLDERAPFTLVDIPGLIEGAHAGRGLGDRFLRHVERSRLLLHLVDISGSEGRDPLEDYHKVNEELRAFSPTLAERPQVVAGNKADLLSAEGVREVVERFAAQGIEMHPVSALTGQGLRELLQLCSERLAELKPCQPRVTPRRRVYRLPAEPELLISRDGDSFTVSGEQVRRLARLIIKDWTGLDYLLEQLERLGVIRELRQHGLQGGALIRLGDLEFTYKERLTSESPADILGTETSTGR
ncbi:MAG: GTPase ObgE [Candidatus Acetothermia bacterium]|jgi:GTP-binding protein|nr:GTPase ObgE [Candidatus Acetothermia bacterium]MDH7506053.1 GTPase ObgE [Candidatus Acetothermia bacterium]